MKSTPIESSYKKAEKILTDLSNKYNIPETEILILKGEINNVMVSLHNEVVSEMRENLLPEINKLYERHGYKK